MVVAGYSNATGSFTVSVEDLAEIRASQPPARELPLAINMAGNTADSSDTRQPSCGSAPGTRDEVWRFVAPTTRFYRVQVQARFDSTLAVYAAGSSRELGCNDDSGSATISQLILRLDAGAAYDVVVDGYNKNRAAYEIGVFESDPPPTPPVTPQPPVEPHPFDGEEIDGANVRPDDAAAPPNPLVAP